MWSRKLHTIYWDASTSFSEDVILNIRRIQETKVFYSQFPGLQNLWIDYFEDKVRDQSDVRMRSIFSEFCRTALGLYFVFTVQKSQRSQCGSWAMLP